MKTILQISVTLVTLLLLASSGYSQTLGFTYQAVIINPEVQVLPGNDIYGGVLAESEVSLRFSIDSYQEEHYLTTDKYGMIALMVGQGDVLSGDFNSIVWDGSGISLLVEIDFSATGDEYEDLDTHMLTYTPHPMTNEELEWIEGIELNIEINALAIIAEEARALAAEALIQADVDLNESDSDLADASIQADVDQNESDSVAADAAIQADVDQNELDSDAADAAIQSDVDQNELDSVAADSAIQADVDQNEVDSDAADADIQADVDQNELDSDSADAVIQSDVDQNELDSDLADAAIQSDVDLNTASIASHNTADEDLSSSNEIQDLSLNNNTLSITNNANASDIDLSIYLDDSTLSFGEIETMGFVAVTDSRVDIGIGAGESNQSVYAVAIGQNSGKTAQGENSVAIGAFAGHNSQHDNTIVLNAQGNPLNTTSPNSLYISPIRDSGFYMSTGTSNTATMFVYNPGTKEITRLTPPSPGIYVLISVNGTIQWTPQ